MTTFNVNTSGVARPSTVKPKISTTSWKTSSYDVPRMVARTQLLSVSFCCTVTAGQTTATPMSTLVASRRSSVDSFRFSLWLHLMPTTWQLEWWTYVNSWYKWVVLSWFLLCDAMRKRGLCCCAVSVCLFICRSRWCITSRWLKISSNFFHGPVAHHSSFLTPAPVPNFKGNPFSGGAKHTRVGKICDFRPNSQVLDFVATG